MSFIQHSAAYNFKKYMKSSVVENEWKTLLDVEQRPYCCDQNDSNPLEKTKNAKKILQKHQNCKFRLKIVAGVIWLNSKMN